MSKEEVEQLVDDLLTPLLHDQDVLIESVVYNDKGQPPTLQIVVDRVQGTESVSLDEIGEISRILSDALDVNDPVPGEYLLEVSTPGAESDLKRLRHFQRNLGRLVQVKLRDGTKTEGILEDANETGFSLKTDSGSRYFEYENVRRARPRVQFGKGGR